MMRFEAASLLTPKPARARPHGLAGVQLLLDAFLQRDPPAMFCPCDATSLAWVPGTVVVALMAGSVRAGRLTSVMPETIDPTAPDLLRRTPLFVRAGHEGWTHTTEGRHMFGAIRDRILPGIEAYERAGRDDVTQRLPAALAALDVPSAARSYHYMVHTGATLIHQAGVAAGATAGASERLLWPTRQEFGFSDLDAALRARLDADVGFDDLLALGHLVASSAGVMEARGYDGRAERLLMHTIEVLGTHAEAPTATEYECTRLFDLAMELSSQRSRIRVGADAPVHPEGNLLARIASAA